MDWKQLKLSVDEKKKEQHLRVVEEVLGGRRVRVSRGRGRFDWAMALTVLLTAVVLCFLVMLPVQDTVRDVDTAVASGSYEKGYVYQGSLDRMPDSVLTYGVKKLTVEKLETLERLFETGVAVEVRERVGEPIYELGLMREDVEQYVRIYYDAEYDGYVLQYVDENRWVHVGKVDWYELFHQEEPNELKVVGMVLFAVLALSYIFVVEKVYMKDEEGRKRKRFAKLWHRVIAGGCWIAGITYILWVQGAFIPIAYLLSISGFLVVAFLDRANSEFKYRKHFYSSQILFILLHITVFSFANTF